jgi:hypothetical protein
MANMKPARLVVLGRLASHPDAGMAWMRRKPGGGLRRYDDPPRRIQGCDMDRADSAGVFRP